METANELLRNWRDINKLRGDRAAKLPRHQIDQIPTSTQSLDVPMGQLKLSTPEPTLSTVDTYGRPASVPPPSDRYPDPRHYQPTSPQQQLPSAQQTSTYGPPRPIQGPPPGARVPVTPGYPQEQVIPSRIPVPYDTSAPLLENPYGPSPGGYQVWQF